MKIIGSSTTQMKRIIFMTMSVFYNVYRTCELNDVLEKDSFEIENNINNLMPVSYCSDKCEDSNNICNEKNKRKIVYSKDIMFNGGNRKYKRKCDLNDKKSLEVYNDETICNKSTSFQQTHNESNFLDSTENFDIFENIIEFCFADSNNINDSLTTMNVSNPANSYKLNIYDDENEDNSTEEKTIASENAKNKPDSFCLIEKRMKVFDTYLQDLKTQILIFFDSKISKNYKLFYVKRLDILNLAFKIIDISDLKDIQKKPNFSLRDQHLIKSIKQLYINFKDVKSFDKKTSEKFSIKFDQLFMIKMNEIIEEKIVESSGYEKYYFYVEILRLYEHVNVLPELLVLSSLYTAKKLTDVSFILHIINLFIENIGNLKENKTFVLLMINKAFKFSYRKELDLFFYNEFNVICCKEHLNLNLFLWEIHSTKRHNIKERIELTKLSMCKNKDKVHLKAILCVYLYQHFKFLTFYNFSVEEFNFFKCFIVKVLNSNNCFACHFDEYLEIFKRQMNFLT